MPSQISVGILSFIGTFSRCIPPWKTSECPLCGLDVDLQEEEGEVKEEELEGRCQNHSADDAVHARAKGPCLRGRTETAFTP